MNRSSASSVHEGCQSMQPHSLSARTATLPQVSLPKRFRVFANIGWMETFVFCQFLLPGIMFLPGTQSVRTILRTLPYLSCALLLPVYHSRVKRLRLPPGSRLIAMALLLLSFEMLHPE